MIDIEIYNHKCILKGINAEQEALITKSCTIFLQKYMPDQFGNKWDVHKLFNAEDSSIPRGFLNEIEETLKKNHIKFTKTNKENAISQTQRFTVQGDLPKLRAWQKQCLKQIAKPENNQGTIAATTGTGKSRVILETVISKQGLTLIVVPTESIRNNLESLFASIVGSHNVTSDSVSKKDDYLFKDMDTAKADPSNHAPSKKFGKLMASAFKDEDEKPAFKNKNRSYLDQFKKTELDDSEERDFLNNKSLYKDKKNDMNLYEKNKKKAKNAWQKKIKPITIICANSLANISDIYLEMVEVLVVDECHISTSSWVRNATIKMKNAGYRYFFSATPWRDMAGQMKMLISVIGTNLIYEYRGKEAADDETIARPSFKMINAPVPTTWLKELKNRREIIEKCIIGNATRNNRIVEEAMEQYENNKNIFIAVDEISHLEILKEKFKKLNVEVVVIHGQLPSFEKEQKIKKVGTHKGAMITIGTMAVGIGTDMPEINVVIIASGGMSTIRFLQRIGRGSRRTSASFLVIDFFDWFHPKMIKYSHARMRTFNSEYQSPKELTQFVKAHPEAKWD